MTQKLKNSRTPLVNRDLCLKKSGGNQYEMILIVAARARELARDAVRNNEYEIDTTIDAMLELQEGKYGREYLNKIREKK